jgi:hypothetical protein
MSNYSSSSFRPSTLPGIKKLAKAVGREQGLSHYQALEIAARRAGYTGYAHALRQLDDSITAAPDVIWLSAHWREDNRVGRETMPLRLAVPLASIITPHQVRAVRDLHGFHYEFSDHLERRLDVRGRARAQELLVRAGHALRFLATTGLRPATTRSAREPLSLFRELPERDHASIWVDSHGGWAYLDEPYNHHRRDSLIARRNDWLAARGLPYDVLEAAWPGLHAPNRTIP